MRNAVVIAIIGMVVLALAAVYSGGTDAVRALLPPAVAERVVAFLDPDAVTGPVSGDGSLAVDFLEDGPDGLMARGPIAAQAGNLPVFIGDVVDGHQAPARDDLPSEIMTIRPILGCRLTPPLAGTTVGHVTAGSGGYPTALATYDDAELAAAVDAFVAAYRASVGDGPAIPDAGSYTLHDVAVNVADAPVYLVLAASGGDRLWNLHLAEGTRVERVVLLGGAQAGIANLDPVVPVEVLLDDGLADCGLVPAYPPNAGNRLVLAPDLGGLPPADATRALEALSQQVLVYDTWFRDSFGVQASVSRIGFAQGAVALVGPVPPADGRAAFAPLAGAKIRMTQDQFFEVQGQMPSGEGFAARVRAIATSFAFGNLDYLRQGVRF